MAITRVGHELGTGTSGNASLTAIPATGGGTLTVLDGDYVVVVTARIGGADSTLTVNSAGWDVIGPVLFANDTDDTHFAVFAKRMGSVPDTTVSWTWSSWTRGCHAIIVYRGVDATTPLDVAVVGTTGTNSTLINPGSIAPVTSGAVILVGGATVGNTDTLPIEITTIPAEYDWTDKINAAGGTGRHAALGVADKAWSSGPFDGSAWTCNESLGSSGWCAYAIALRPAATGGRTATLTAQESGSDAAAISAAVIVTASLGAQEAGQDVAAATIAAQIAASMAAQEAGSDSLAATLAAAVSASMAAQEAGSDSFAATLTLSSGRVIALVAQETGADTASATASVAIAGALAAQEAGQDVAAGGAAVSVSAALAATEAGTDGFAASLSAAVTAALQAQEAGADGMAAAMSVAITATIAAQEAGSDVFTGTLLTVEVVIGPPDIAIPATWPDHRIAATWPAGAIPAVWPAPVAIATTWREA